jgi:hypothetical protein
MTRTCVRAAARFRQFQPRDFREFATTETTDDPDDGDVTHASAQGGGLSDTRQISQH